MRAGWLFLAGLVACGVSGAEASSPELAAAGYPRIASYFIESYVSPENAAVMARSEVAIVDVEAMAHSPKELAAIASSSKLLAYLTSEEIPHDAGEKERPLAAARFEAIAPSEWLVEPGSTLRAGVSATATRLRVAHGAAFSPVRPPSDFYGEEEPTFLLVDGEHMRLVAVEGDELVVERGYHSRATSHAAGAKVAAHVVFFAGTWMLNLAEDAPAPNGTTWRDRLVDEAAALVAKGPWRGVFLDVCFEDIAFLNGGVLDVNGDGVADDPVRASASWSAGMGHAVDALRARLGPDVPLMANPGGQNCPHPRLDGILLEGWPVGLPPDFLAFDVGMERYLSWSKRGFTIANAFSPKIGFGTIEPGDDEKARTDYPAMRFGLGVALMGDGLYAFDNGVFGHYVTWRYDEYDAKLGRPLGEPTRDGDVWQRAFEHGLAVVNTGSETRTVRVPEGYRKLRGTQDPRHNDGRPAEELRLAAKDAYVLVRD